ncbi:hypothetical protein MPSEU_000399400 [Mayamaea pseudoterrestris]|nr:hypothetical protein MPSEU_000399400 [Mayamaea pseudoterrestris]
MSFPKRKRMANNQSLPHVDAADNDLEAALAPPLKASLQELLHANRNVQETILTQLQEIARNKLANRRQRDLILRQAADEHVSRRRRDNNLAATAAPRRKKWDKSFFTGPDHSQPQPNSDTLRRRKLEQATFLYHSQPPWSKSHSEILWNLMQTANIATGTTTKDGNNTQTAAAATATAGSTAVATAASSASIDWDQISNTLRDVHDIHQSPDSCRLRAKRLRMERSQTPFTKSDAIKMSELLHLQPNPNWNDIAQVLSTDGNVRQRTPWECLVAYQTKLRPVQPFRWSLLQDEFLLKYLAAAGPQCVVDGTMVRDFATILSGVPKSHLLARINSSLLNPNLKHEAWSDEEERRLCILMKVYSRGGAHESEEGSSASPLFLTSTHFPNRSTKAVSDKWNRSLDPAYSSRPFTPQEDAKLLRLVREYPDLGWTRLSHEHFNSRHGQRLAHRWTELADHDAIVAQSKLVQSRRHHSPQDAAATLTERDFVVHVKQNKRVRKG